MSKIGVVGIGRVGLVTAACLSELGHTVVGQDIDQEKVWHLNEGAAPVYEPDLKDVVNGAVRAGLLSFTTVYSEAVQGARFVFIAVDTPAGEDGAADLRHLDAAVRGVAMSVMNPYPVVVIKSTVPVGTSEAVQACLRQLTGANGDFCPVVYNPEFLREGTAVSDFREPQRVVVGADDPTVAEAVAQLYSPLECPVVTTDFRTAEMIKYAANVFLATKISFINEVAAICEATGADVVRVAEAIGMDRRIGRSFLDAGLGYGGGCLPKDLATLIGTARAHGYDASLLSATAAVNACQRLRLVGYLKALLGGTLKGATISLLGLAFKPQTDDVRAAPAADIIGLLQREGARIRAYDPAAMDNMRRLCPEVEYCPDALTAAAGGDALVLVTEWPEFADLDFDCLRQAMNRPIVVDGRNLWEPAVVRGHGFVYVGLGRPLRS